MSQATGEQTYPVSVIRPFASRAASDVHLLCLNDLEAIVGNPIQAGKILEVAIFRLGIKHCLEAVHTLVAKFCACCNRSNARDRFRGSCKVGAGANSISDAFRSSKDIVVARASIKTVGEL